MKCLNKNVLIALAAGAVMVAVLKPSWLLTGLPLLLLAVCPLSMMIMMRHMSGRAGSGDTAGTPVAPDADMNREIQSPQAELRALKTDHAHRTTSDAPTATAQVHTPSTIYVQRP